MSYILNPEDSDGSKTTGSFDILIADLLKALNDAKKNKRSTLNTLRYETYSIFNTIQLAHTIHERLYYPSRGIAFISRDPVLREIFAAAFRDRIVHHYIYNKTADWWMQRFIKNTYSCIPGRGAIQAINDVWQEMHDVSNGFQEEAYFIKLDLQGYFMSLNRKRLLKCALDGLREQYAGNYGYEFRTLEYLWTQIILDDPVRSANFRDYPHDWKQLPPSKSLLNQPAGVGIVIGNLTSQLLSNIYLNDFDWYVTTTLGYSAYNRYVDDFVIIVNARDLKRALKDLKKIEDFLSGKGLRLHPKKREIQPIQHGLKFLGFRIFPNRIVPGDRVRRNARQAAHRYQIHCANGESVLSYFGMIQHFDSEPLRDFIVDCLENTK